MVWYRAGAADETQGTSGIAHFLEHLMFKGTKEVAPGEFSRIVARVGGRDNAFTSWDYTAFFQNVARDRLDTVMRIEADRMANLRLAESDVLTERDVIVEERRQRIDQSPGAKLRERTMAMLFANHPYGRPVIGWEHEMKALSRADALAWYGKWYAPNNAMLIVAGDVTPAEVKALAEKYYGPIPRKPVPETRVRPQEPPALGARRIELRDTRVRQPSWSRAWLAPSHARGLPKLGPEAADALDVAATILGGGPTSRLVRALVHERELATSAGVSYGDDALDLQSFWVYASPKPGIEIAALETAVEKVLAETLAAGFTDEEVARAKARMADDAVFARDSLQSGARAIGVAFTTGKDVAWVENWPNRLAAVTTAQVNAALRAVLDPDAHVTAILLPKPGS
ncbi:MAG: insulinase family protein [Alphaproteobacteria bacterium]|nr:insulinase family protein [Alphaproteobacteria bacterium]